VDGPHRGDGAPGRGVIHTDFERGFIRAEIYTLSDLEKYHTKRRSRKRGRCGWREGVRDAGWGHLPLPVQRVSTALLFRWGGILCSGQAW